MLSSYKRMFTDALNDDGLLVLARGIGVSTIFCKFLKLHSTSVRPGEIVLVLNTHGNEKLLNDMLLAGGLSEVRLPKAIDYDMVASDRLKLYERGGVFYMTPRILTVDILMNRLRRESVIGILVYSAERVTDQSNEAFVIKLYREVNGTGFVKAFTEEPEMLTTGFGRLEKTMRALHARKVFLWPRFHVMLAGDLDASPPEVIECSQPMTASMHTIQRSIIQCMDNALVELRRTSKFELDELTVENNLFESFDVLIRRQLDPVWNTVKPRAKQLVADLKTLRKLLNYLLRYDAVSFYTFLDTLRLSAVQQTTPSEWLRSDAGTQIFKAAKARLYAVHPATSSNDAEDTDILNQPLQVRDIVRDAHGKQVPLGATFQTHITEMTIELEHNPKWHLLLEVLDEIYAAIEAVGSGDPDGARVLIAVKDERTMYQLRELLSVGAQQLLRTSFARLLIKQSSRTKTLQQLVLQSQSLSKRPEFWNMGMPLRTTIGGAPSMLPADEADLWRAAEVPGWFDAKATASVVKAPGASTDALEAASNAVDLGLPKPAGAASASSAATPQAQPLTWNAAGNVRPHVLAEQRLLWKATAQAMERERRELLNQHLATLDNVVEVDTDDSNEQRPLDVEALQAMSLAELVQTQGILDSQDVAFAGFASSGIDLTTEGEDEVDKAAVKELPLQAVAALIAGSHAGTSGAATTSTQLHTTLRATLDQADGAMDDQLREMLSDALGKKVARRTAQAITKSEPAAKRARSVTAPTTVEAPASGPVAHVAFSVNDGGKSTKIERKQQANPVLMLLKAHQGVHQQKAKDKAKKAQEPSTAPAVTRIEISVEPASPAQVVIFPLSRMENRYPILADLRPTFIVAYDPDPTFTREIEVYKATICGGNPLRVYFLVYEASAEQQKYLSSIKKERQVGFLLFSCALYTRYVAQLHQYTALNMQAFERLVAEKSHIAPVSTTSAGAGANTTLSDTQTIRKGTPDGWGITTDGVRSAAKTGATGALALLTGRQSLDRPITTRPLTVDICCQDRGKRRIIIDMREFRAKLPMRLYSIGLDTIPATLEVGDFILSPEMCVERKSVPDLFGSFNSGRLYSQAEAMVKYYKRPVLCIEFDEDRPFTLQLSPDMPADIEITNPVSKVVLLVLHFPTLRILWCRTPMVTATYFASLKQLQDEPDEATASNIGSDRGLSAGSATAPDAAAPTSRNYVGLDMLRKFPGVNATNFRKLIAAAPTLAAVAAMPLPQLTTVLGEGNAGLLHAFLHGKNSGGL